MRPSRLPALGLALSLLSVGPLSGCASVPKAAPALDVEAKSFTPSPGKARLYVVRPSSMVGSAVALHVVVDGRELGSTSRGTYLMTEVEPGDPTGICKMDGSRKCIYPEKCVAGNVASTPGITSPEGLVGYDGVCVP